MELYSEILKRTRVEQVSPQSMRRVRALRDFAGPPSLLALATGLEQSRPLGPEVSVQKICGELEMRDIEIARLVAEREVADMQRLYIDFVTHFLNSFISFYEKEGTWSWRELQRLIRLDTQKAVVNLLSSRDSPLQRRSVQEEKARSIAYKEADRLAQAWGTTYPDVEMLLRFRDLRNDRYHSDKKNWEAVMDSYRTKEEVRSGLDALKAGLESLPKGFESYKGVLAKCLETWADDVGLKPLQSVDVNRVQQFGTAPRTRNSEEGARR